MSVFQMGDNTYPIPMTLYKANRSKVMGELKKEKRLSVNGGLVLLQGGNDISHYDTDVDYVFRQESYFLYMFGVTEPGCYGLVDMNSGKSTLFVPHLPEEYSIWMGKLLTLDDFKNKYEVDEVFYADEIEKVLSRKEPSVILTLSGPNTDSGSISTPATFKGIENFVIDSDILHPIIAEW